MKRFKEITKNPKECKACKQVKCGCVEEEVSPEMKEKIRKKLSALRVADPKQRHKIAKKQYERADEEVEISEKVKVTIKKQTSDHPNVSQRHVTYDVYHDGEYHKTFKDINDAMDHKEKMHKEEVELDEALEPWMNKKDAEDSTVPAFMRKKKYEDAMKAATGGAAVRTVKSEEANKDTPPFAKPYKTFAAKKDKFGNPIKLENRAGSLARAAAKSTANEEVISEDNEYEMARNQLATAKRAIDTLTGMLKGEGDLPAWVQAKITQGSAMLDAAADYMASNMKEEADLEEKRGLWDNIHAKQERIKHGSGEHMRKPGSKGAPTAAALKASQSK